MAYRVLLVDDEFPALRFLQSIIEKYTPGFQVANSCTSAEAAYQYLLEHPVDVLITDITMGGENGIELAKRVRKLLPDIHILIVSGYSEFEYAHGAIQASVDNYILKPVSIPQMRQTMAELKNTMDEGRTRDAAAYLPAVACGYPNLQKETAAKFLGNYRFALVQYGGTDNTLPEKLTATSLVQPSADSHWSLYGRWEDERILVFPDTPLEDFLSEISVILTSRPGFPTWTVIYSPEPAPLIALNSFICSAMEALPRQTVIGKHRMLPLNTKTESTKADQLSPQELNRLVYFVQSQKTEQAKMMILNIASEWEEAQIRLDKAWANIRQIIFALATVDPSITKRFDSILSSVSDYCMCAASYSDLLANTCETLFENTQSEKKKLSTEELYRYAVAYVDEHYSKPLSVQSVCDELGISQTYLSRLFRKYSDTTFNAYLTRRRMEAAQELLLQHPDMLLRDVAACVGYEDSSYFSKVFHQFTGMKPSEYSGG